MCKQVNPDVAEAVQLTDRQREKINEAVNRLVEYFGDEVTISGLYQSQALAMTEIISMMSVVINHHPDCEMMLIQNLADTFYMTNELIRMLRPFADVAEENWYRKNLTKPRMNYGNDSTSI